MFHLTNHHLARPFPTFFTPADLTWNGQPIAAVPHSHRSLATTGTSFDLLARLRGHLGLEVRAVPWRLQKPANYATKLEKVDRKVFTVVEAVEFGGVKRGHRKTTRMFTILDEFERPFEVRVGSFLPSEMEVIFTNSPFVTILDRSLGRCGHRHNQQQGVCQSRGRDTCARCFRQCNLGQHPQRVCQKCWCNRLHFDCFAGREGAVGAASADEASPVCFACEFPDAWHLWGSAFANTVAAEGSVGAGAGGFAGNLGALPFHGANHDNDN
ncbi:hypothetical protein N0V85_005570 [Neurospora sp. IMI 360204]|nr:hypothetical protein N0V85_005570 [Neurospora sp. IMI 360204]